MKSIQLWAAAIAVVCATAAAGKANAASSCSQTCSTTFNQCTAGGGVQSTCMTRWMQCRNTCNGVVAKPAKSSAAPKTPIKAGVAKPKAPASR